MPGAGFRPAGSLTIATTEAELRVMEEAVKLPDAADRGFELLAADTVREVNPALRGDFLGGLLCRADGITEPGAPSRPCASISPASPVTSGCPAARPSPSNHTVSATTRASGTAPTLSSSAPAPISPACWART